MTRTAIIAGDGALPHILAAELTEPVFVHFVDMPTPEGATPHRARIEQLGKLFAALKDYGADTVVFAGAMSRPKLNPLKLDKHARRLALSLGKGDDALLREVLAAFAEQGLKVKSATDVCPDLTVPSGTHWGRKLSDEDRVDIERGQAILAALSDQDVGQGVVCAGGQVLGIETLQGTNAMLSFVAQTPDHLRRAKGVFVKAPKATQDMRIDIPTIGPETIDHAIAAGLGGLAVPADGVLILERETMRRRIEEAGLFLTTL